MPDLTRIDAAQAVELTDGISQTAALKSSNTDGTEVGLAVREARIGQQTMAASFPVVVASDQTGTSYLEDDPHAHGDRGAFVLAVRNDGGSTTFTNTNGDYSPIAVDAQGKVLISGSIDIPGTITVTGTVTATPPGTITTASTFAEDSVHTSGHFGTFVLAVRNDSASTTFTSANGDYSPIATDAQGKVFITGTVTSAIAQSVTIVPSGTQTVTGTVTSVPSGTVTTVYSGTQTVAITSGITSASEYAEDSIHTTGHTGSFILAVRNDSAATTFASATGDYSPISVDNVGRVFVTGTVTSAIAQSVTIVPSGTQTVTGTVTSVPSGTQAVSIAQTVTTTYSGTQTVAITSGVSAASDYAEDSVHTTGHVGSFILAVRNDSAATTFASATGDYSPISVDNVGRVFIVGTVTSTIAQSVTIVPSGTQAVSIAQSVTIVPSGTQTVTGTVTSVPSGTQAVSIAQTVTTTYSGTQTVAVSGSLTTTDGYAEDSVHTTGHVGSFILAVRNDSAATTFASATGDYSPISVDNVGRVFITGTVTSVPSGTQAVSIAQSVTIVPSGTQTVTGTVTSVPSGTVTTVYSGTQTVAITSAITSSSEYLEDSVHSSAHYGTFVLAVRNDNASSTFCNASGDYSPISVDDVGRVFITGTVTSIPSGTQAVSIAQSVTIVPSGTQAVSIAQSVTIVPSGTQAVSIAQTVTTVYSGTQTVAVANATTNNYEYAEDSVHTTGHVGAFVLAVRNDSAATTFASATGDYSPISVDNVGRVFVTGTVTSAIAQSVTIVPSGTQTVTGTVTSVPSGTQAVSIAQTVTTTYSGTQTVVVSGTLSNSDGYAEDSVHTTGHVGSFILAVRNDSAATTFASANGDYSPISVDNVGRVFVTGTVTSAITQSVTIVPSGTQAVSIAQSVTIVPSGTQTVTGTVTSVPSGTQAVSIAQTVTTVYSGTQTVALANAATNNFEYAEDSIHTTAHVGAFVLAVRNDSATTTFTSATGDYSPISVDNVGRVFVTGTVTSAIAQSVTIVPSGTQAVSIAQSVTIVPSGTQAVSIAQTVTTTYSGTQTVAVSGSLTTTDGYAEDSVHTTGHVGSFVLAVRNDSASTTFASATGDYSPISVDNVGRVFVTGTVTSAIAQSVTIVPSGTQAVSIAQSVTIVPSGTQTVTGTVTSVPSGTQAVSIAQTVTTVYSGTQTVAVANATTNNYEYAEDSVHTTGHVGAFVLAVRNDSAATTFASASGDYSPISVDNVGRVFVTGTVTSAIAQSVTIVPSGTQTVTGTVTSVPSGTQAVSIAQTVTTVYSGTQTVALANAATNNFEYQEDSIHTTAHVGAFVLAVRNDSAATTFTSATGDYSPISVDNVGRVFVTGTVTSAIAQSVTIVPSGTQAVSIAQSVTIVPSGTQTVTGTVTSVPSGTQAVSIAQSVTIVPSGTQTVAVVSDAGDFAEDSVHTSGHAGTFILAVRNDSATTTFTSATGDYSPISVDNVGRVFVTGTVTSAIAQSVTIVPSGTQTVTGTVTSVPSGTQAVSIAQSVTIVPSGTQAVSIAQTVTTVYSGTQTVAVANATTNNYEYAEDSIHTTAHVGAFVLAVRNDSSATTFTSANGDYSPISVDNVGRVFVTGTVTSAIAQSVTIVPSGTQAVSIAQSVTIVPSGTQAVSIAQTVTTTYSGTQTVAVTGTVTTTAGTGASEWAEDSVHTTGHIGTFVLAVRNDSAATTFASATGDYSPISVDNVGRVFVTGTVTSAIAQSVTIVPSGTQAVSLTQTVTTTYSGTQTVAVSGTLTNSDGYAEDSVHTTGHVGAFVLAVRNDSAATTFTSATGDYSPISVDNVGRVFVTGTVTSAIAQSVTIVPSGTQTVTGTVTSVPSGTTTVTGTVTTVASAASSEWAEDSVHTSGHVGTFVLAVRNDSAATTFASATGDYSPISVDNVGRVFVTGTVTSAIAQSVTIVPSGTQTVTGTVTSVSSVFGQQTMANSIPVVIASDQTGTSYIEDDPHANGDRGAFILAVRNDGGSTTFTNTNGDYSPIAVDAQGKVLISGSIDIPGTITVSGLVTTTPSGTITTTSEYAEDSVHTSGHFGSFMLAVRNDSASTTFTSANGDYSPVSVDAQGRIIVTGTVTTSGSGGGTEYAEDSVHTSGHLGTQMLAVRNDAVATTFASANGDYSPISVDNVGRVFVTGTVTSTIAQSVTIVPSGTQAVSLAQTVTTTYSGTQTVAVTGTVTTSGSGGGTEFAEDSVHTSGHLGTQMLAVRNDSAATTFTSANGDYSPISVDNVGRVFVTGTVTSAIAQSVTIVPSGTQAVSIAQSVTIVPSGTQAVSIAQTVTTTYSGTQTVAVSGSLTTTDGYAEDSVHTTGHVGSFILAVRNDSAATTFASASGDYSPISVDNVGRVFVTGTVTSAIAQSVTIVPSGTQAVSIAQSVTIVPSGTQAVSLAQTVTTIYSGTQTVAVTGTVTTSGGGGGTEYAEDSVHTSGHLGTQMLAVRNDAVATTFASTNGDYSPISVDNVGQVFVTGTVTSAIAQSVTIVPSGTQAVSLAQTVTTTYSGTQTVAVTGTVTTSGGGGGTEYAEDSVHTSGHLGTQMLAVRNDSAATTFASANGDYSPISVDNVGRVFVTGTVTSAIAQSVTIVPSGTQAVSIAQSVTIVPSGTQTVTGTVTSVPSGTQTVAVSGSVTTADNYAEDSVHTTGHVGSFILAVRNDSAATTFASTNGDYSPISVDNVGRVFVAGTVTSTIAQSVTIVPSGTQAVSLAQTVTTTYSGTQTVAVTGTVTTSGGGGGTEYAEDSVHTSGHLGTQMLAVRNDAVATTFASANGDYSPISVDNVGRVFVTGTVTSVSSVFGQQTMANSIPVVIASDQTGTGYLEDSPHANADRGSFILAVRNDALATTFTSANGDYSPISVDDLGRIFVTGTVTTTGGSGGGTEFAEDSVHTSGHLGTQMLAVRNDSAATTFTSATGDYSPISVDNVGRVFITGSVTSVPSGTQTVAVTGTVTTSAAAGASEFAEDSVHTTGHTGTFILAVRNDAAAVTLAGTNGDYSPISVDLQGKVFVTGTVTATVAQSVTIVPSGTQTVTGVTDFAEDSVHTSGHVGTFVLAVRNDSAATTFASATGDYSPISVDNVGRVFVTGTVTSTIAQSVTIVPSGTQTVTGTVTSVASTGTRTITGDVANDTTDSGNPIKIGGMALTANPTAVATGDRVNAMFDTLGKQVVLQGSIPDLYVDGRIELTTTTSTNVIAAGGAGVRTMLTHIAISNANTSAVTVSILDGASQKWTFYVAGGGGGAVVDLNVPVRGTVTTAWNAQVNTSSWTAASGSGVYVTCAGYRAV